MAKILKNQQYQLLAYIILGGVLYIVTWEESVVGPKSFGLAAYQWIIFSWIFAGVFQFWIAICWRLEFHQQTLSKLFGQAGFLIFRVGFVTFGALRFLPLFPISFLTVNTLPIPNGLRLILIILSTPFILWGMYSVAFYFGLNRAFGADHFDPSYRTKTLEIRGIFKYIPNSMYTVVLLLLYHPALFWFSKAGLITALFHHTFVWVHYFCTEKPDMKEIYQNP